MRAQNFSEDEMEHIHCDLCGSNDYEHVLTSEDIAVIKIISDTTFNIVRCKKCGLFYINPRPKKDLLFRFYDETFRNESNPYWSFEKEHSIKSKNYLQKISKYSRRGRIIDVGCGDGSLLKVAKDNNWETIGVEVSEPAAKRAMNEFGLKIFIGELEEAKYPDAYFDVVVMHEVLEHLYSPQKELNEVNRILKNEGLLYIRVPNIKFGFWVFHKPKKIPAMDIIRHFYGFSPKTLKKMLHSTGFEIVKLTTNNDDQDHLFKHNSALLSYFLVFLRNVFVDLDHSKVVDSKNKRTNNINEKTMLIRAMRFLLRIIDTPIIYLEEKIGLGLQIECFGRKRKIKNRELKK